MCLFVPERLLVSNSFLKEFWRLVKETVADHFEQLKADLTKKETEWRNSFKGRPMSRVSI
jgi:hypothetical protein